MSQWNPDKIRLNIARDLREIRRLYAGLRVEAIHHAADQLMPGGEAMVMLGPVADSEAWSYAEISAALGRTEAHGLDDFDTDPEPPLLVLAGWEDCIRAELGTQTNKRASIEGAAKFIGSSVDWALDSNEDGEINFLEIDAMAHSIHIVRMRLENVLKDGERSDKGAPCLQCGRALVKVWHDAAKDDAWRCHNCDDNVSPERYKNAVREAYLEHATKLTATDILEAYRIRPGTLMVWATRGKVRKRGKDDSGRQLYDVDDAVEQRDKDEKEGAA